MTGPAAHRRTHRHARVRPLGRARGVRGVRALLAGAMLVALGGGLGAARLDDGVPVSRWLDGAARPPLAGDAAARPLAHPERAPAGTGGYRLMETQDDGSGRPVRWDPCRPIHYVVRTAGATPTGLADLRAGLARLSAVTGLRFTDDGPTDEAPRADRPPMDTGRYGERWSPVLIAWTTPAEFGGMRGYAGLGGPHSVAGARPGQRRYVTGLVLLNADHLRQVEVRPGGAAQEQAVIRHELGHLAGLDHQADDTALMNPRPDGTPADYAAGDLRGLAALSNGPCYRDF